MSRGQIHLSTTNFCLSKFAAFLFLLYFFFQIIPNRLDWEGNEHEQSFEEFVSTFFKVKKMFQI